MFFHDDLKKIHDRFRHAAIVLLPSSEQKLKERGFLPVRRMLEGIRLPMIEPFYKINNHKQSLQSFKNRQNIRQVIQMKQEFTLPAKPLLILDDVCTSGATLHRAYELLQKHTYKIEALVLCAHPMFVESCDKKHLWRFKSFSILKHVVRNGR